MIETVAITLQLRESYGTKRDRTIFSHRTTCYRFAASFRLASRLISTTQSKRTECRFPLAPRSIFKKCTTHKCLSRIPRGRICLWSKANEREISYFRPNCPLSEENKPKTQRKSQDDEIRCKRSILSLRLALPGQIFFTETMRHFTITR